MGRPQTFTEPKRKAYLEKLRAGGQRLESAQSIGVHPGTVARYVAKHSGYAEERDDAEMLAHDKVIGSLFQQCLKGKLGAIVFYLCNKMPGQWRSVNRIEITGMEGGPVRFEDLVKALSETRAGETARLGLVPRNGTAQRNGRRNGNGRGVAIPPGTEVAAKEGIDGASGKPGDLAGSGDPDAPSV